MFSVLVFPFAVVLSLVVPVVPLPAIRRGADRRWTRGRRGTRCRGEGGQATAEYALVLIGAAGLALLFIGWATRTDAIGTLFDHVMDQIKGRVR